MTNSNSQRELTEDELAWIIDGLEINQSCAAKAIPVQKLVELFDIKSAYEELKKENERPKRDNNLLYRA